MIGSGKRKKAASACSLHAIQLTAQDRAHGFRIHRTPLDRLAAKTINFHSCCNWRDTPFECAGSENSEEPHVCGDSAAGNDQVSRLRIANAVCVLTRRQNRMAHCWSQRPSMSASADAFEEDRAWFPVRSPVLALAEILCCNVLELIFR